MLEANFPEDQTTQRHAVNVIVLAVLGETQLSSAMLTIPSFLGEKHKQVSCPTQSSVWCTQQRWDCPHQDMSTRQSLKEHKLSAQTVQSLIVALLTTDHKSERQRPGHPSRPDSPHHACPPCSCHDIERLKPHA